MSASTTVFTSTQISSREFLSFILSHDGFISNDITIDGGFSNGNSHVWFYGAKKTLNPQENEIDKVNMQLPMNVSSWIYFELSSAEGSDKLMTDIFQKMGQMWPVSMRCNLYRIFSYDTFELISKNEEGKIILSNHIELFFTENEEDKIKNSLVNILDEMIIMNSEKQDNRMPFLENVEILKVILIHDVSVYFSIIYEYEENDNELTEALTKVLKNAPRFFCEVHFGYDLDTLAEKSLIFFLADLLRKNNGVGMGIFESTVTLKDVTDYYIYPYIKFE